MCTFDAQGQARAVTQRAGKRRPGDCSCRGEDVGEYLRCVEVGSGRLFSFGWCAVGLSALWSYGLLFTEVVGKEEEVREVDAAIGIEITD